MPYSAARALPRARLLTLLPAACKTLLRSGTKEVLVAIAGFSLLSDKCSETPDTECPASDLTGGRSRVRTLAGASLGPLISLELLCSICRTNHTYGSNQQAQLAGMLGSRQASKIVPLHSASRTQTNATGRTDECLGWREMPQ